LQSRVFAATMYSLGAGEVSCPADKRKEASDVSGVSSGAFLFSFLRGFYFAFASAFTLIDTLHARHSNT
jgi:hypothetical protein